MAKNENDMSITDNKIDYEKVNKIIEKERKKSIDWLDKSLKE